MANDLVVEIAIFLFADAGGTDSVSVGECLEPISKSPEEDNEAGELSKAQEILGIVLPADGDFAAAAGSR